MQPTEAPLGSAQYFEAVGDEDCEPGCIRCAEYPGQHCHRAFADVGYEGATTNAIAARADISPGSLYQFFSNKEAIAEALAAGHADGLRAAREAALGGAENLPLDEMVGRVVDPIVAFNVANPGFKALLADPAVPERLTAATSQLQEELVARVEPTRWPQHLQPQGAQATR